MLDVSRDIRSLTDFKTRSPEFLASLREKDRAILLTVNGRAELAVMSAATFQRVLDSLDELDAIRGIRAGLDDAAARRTRTAREAFEKVREKKPRRRRTG